MKTSRSFEEYICEGIADNHSLAARVIKPHAHDLEHASDHEDGHLHLGAVHPSKVETIHKNLEKSGFTKHPDLHEPIMGVRSGGGGDGKTYHKFSNGNTHVYVAHKPNASADVGGNKFDHHQVEIHTE